MSNFSGSKNCCNIGLLIIMLFLFLQSVNAYGPNVINAKSIEANVSIASTLELHPTSSDADFSISSVKATLKVLPNKDSRNSFVSHPLAQEVGNDLLFSWKNPKERLLFYGFDSTISNSFSRKKIPHIEYPITNLPSELRKYVQPTEIITSGNADIAELAHELSSGENDLFVVATKINHWVRSHVQYSLDTLTAEIAEPADWVLQNRRGVCDEITSLTIALLRSIGIPSRFVVGMAYTNSPLLSENWGSHGWAEVYFPTVGWVPFDPTFGEYGWIDAGHIKLKDSVDPKEPATTFEWLGNNVNLTPQALHLSAILLSAGEAVSPNVNIVVSPEHGRVGFGSLNLIHATVQNLQDSFVAEEITLVNVTDMTILDDQTQLAILAPHESKKLSWKVRVRNDLNPSFSYTLPVIAGTLNNLTGSSSFLVSHGSPVYALDSISSVIEASQVESATGKLSCTSSRSWMYPYDETTISCLTLQKSAEKLCLLDMCKQVTPLVSTYTFPLQYTTPGNQTFLVRLGKIAVPVSVDMRDIPTISVDKIVAPASVTLSDTFKISWQLEQSSISMPLRVRVALEPTNLSWISDPFKASVYEVEMNGQSIGPGERTLTIKTTWRDENGKEYATQKELQLNVSAAWWESVLWWIGSWFG